MGGGAAAAAVVCEQRRKRTMGNCQALPCTTSDADKKAGGNQEVVEEVETLQEQASAKSGKLISVSLKAASSKKSKSGKSSRAMSTKSATMASEPSEDFGAKSGVSEADIPEEGVDVELTTDDSTEAVIADGTVASKTSFKSVGFPEEEEEEEDLYADSGFLTKVYVSVFDALFNTLLFVLSSAAALLHMLTRPISSISDPNLSILKWPEMLPMSRIATKRFASFIGMEPDTKEE